MKRFFPVGLLLAINDGVAHPGHGKPGPVHFHEFSDGLLSLSGLVAVALLYWAWNR